MKKGLKSLAFLLSVFVVVSCINRDHFNFDNISETSWNPKLALPLLKSEVGVYQLFGATDSNAVSINGKNVTLIYGRQKLNLNLNEVIQLQDIVSPAVLVPFPVAPTRVPLMALDTNFDNIQSINLSEGNLSVSTSNSSANGNLTFEFNEILDNSNNPLRINLAAGSNGNQDLGNYSILTGDSLSVTVSSDVPLTCDVSLSITGLDYESVDGDFSGESFNVGKGEFQLHLFKNIAATGEITVSRPQLIIESKNGFELAFEPSFRNVFAINPAGGNKTRLIEGNNPTPLVIAAARSKTQVTESRMILDETNSNLQSFIGISPKTIEHNLGLSVSKSMQSPQTLYKGDACDLSLRVELPLEGKIATFEVLDTVQLQVTNDLTLIKDFLIKTYTKNGFPLDTRISIALMDENKELMKKADGSNMMLLNEIFTQAAAVNSSGEVEDPLEYSAEHQLVDEEVLAKLPLARYGQLRASMNTTNQGNDNVKILSDYTLQVRLGVKLTGNIDLINEEE